MRLFNSGEPFLVAELNAYEGIQNDPLPAVVLRQVRSNWKPVTAVLIGGLFAGMVFGALRSERTMESNPILLKSTPEASVSQEVSRLETRK